MHSISGVNSCSLRCSMEATELHCPYSKESLLCLKRRFQLLHRAVPCAQSADVAPLSRCVFAPPFCLRISASSQPIIWRNCSIFVSFHFSPSCFFSYTTKIHLTFLTNSAPAYTRQFSLQCPFPLCYSPTIRSSTAFSKLCLTMIPLQKGLLIPLRSPSSQDATILTIERISTQSLSVPAMLSGSGNSLNVVSPSVVLSFTELGIYGTGDFQGLPGHQTATS